MSARKRSRPTFAPAPDVTQAEVAAALVAIDAASSAMSMVRRMALQLQTRNRELDAAQLIVDGLRAQVTAAEAEVARLRSLAPLPVTAVHHRSKQVREQNGELVRVVKACAPIIQNIGAPHCPVCHVDLESQVLGGRHSSHCLLAQVGGLPRSQR